jgi:hypothetical protein
MDPPVVRVVLVTGAWRLSMHRPTWIRRRASITAWVRLFFSSTFPYRVSVIVVLNVVGYHTRVC